LTGGIFRDLIPKNPDPGKIPDGQKIRDFGSGTPENPVGIPSRVGPYSKLKKRSSYFQFAICNKKNSYTYIIINSNKSIIKYATHLVEQRSCTSCGKSIPSMICGGDSYRH
jgi:hypothetical protein